MKVEKLCDRIEKLEYMLGVENTKPKIFQQIDDSFCDIRMDLNDKFRQIKEQTASGAEKAQFIFERVEEFEKSL